MICLQNLTMTKLNFLLRSKLPFASILKAKKRIVSLWSSVAEDDTVPI